MQAPIRTTQATAPADAELVRDLAALAKFLIQTGGRDFYRAVGELELSFTQLRALHVLAERAGEQAVSVKALGDALGLSLPAVSRAVDGLVERGLVTRSECREDRRIRHVAITGDGLAQLDRLVDLRLAGLAGFVGSLPGRERDRLRAALRPIVAREDVAAVRAALPPASPSHERD